MRFNGPLAVTVTQQIARAQADWTVTEEGAVAFAEKRAPVWRGM